MDENAKRYLSFRIGYIQGVTKGSPTPPQSIAGRPSRMDEFNRGFGMGDVAFKAAMETAWKRLGKPKIKEGSDEA